MTVPTLSAESSLRTEADLRRQYGYAIVRIDEFLGDHIPIERRITVKKVVNDPDEADQEVERLNRLQAGKKVRYFSQITRLEHSETQGNQESAQANRISDFLPGQTVDVMTAEKRAELEAIRVPDLVQCSLNFPAFRAYEVCGSPTQMHQLKWNGLLASIYTKMDDGYIDVVCVTEFENAKTVLFAFRVFPDLCETPINKLTPLEIVERMANKFGLMMFAGSHQGKFFMEQEFPLLPSNQADVIAGQIRHSDHPSGHTCMPAFFLRPSPPVFQVALGFVLDTTEYRRWITNR